MLTKADNQTSPDGRTIKQIIPADNWVAVYEGEDGKKYTEPIVCFALVSEITDTGDGETFECESVLPMTFCEYVDFIDHGSKEQGFKLINIRREDE